MDRGPNWIGQEIDFGKILELWRFYQSGQVIHYFAIPEARGATHRMSTSDDAPEMVWSNIRDFVVRFTEIFELAARLSFTQAGDDGIHLEITVDNIEGYLLLPPSLTTKADWIPESRQCSWSRKADFSNLELVADVNELALEWAVEFFQGFTPSPSKLLLKEAQSEFLMRLPR